MATVVSVKFNESDVDQDDEEPLAPEDLPDSSDTNGKPRGLGTDSAFAMIADSQAGVVELSTLITNPNLKRSESSELLNLTLHQCARDGNPDIMGRLLNSLQGNVTKKVNAHDEDHLSALHYAARYNHYPIVKLLLDKQANVNDVDDEGATPLHFAARYKRMRLKTTEDTDEDGHNAEGGQGPGEVRDLMELYRLHNMQQSSIPEATACYKKPVQFTLM